MDNSVKALLFLSGLVIISACRKDDSPGGPFNQDYLECKINGKHFEAQGGGGCTSSLVANYYPQGTKNINPGFFTARGTDCSSPDVEKVGFNIIVLNPSIWSYDVLNDSVRAYYTSRLINEDSGIDSTISGKIQFTTLIPQQYDSEGKRTETGKLEGTFHFTVVDTSGKQYKITDGRFGFFNIQ